MRKQFWIFALAVMIAGNANAQTPCVVGDSEDPELASTLLAPVKYTSQCQCYGWLAPSADFLAGVYLFFVNDLLVEYTAERTHRFCHTEKNVAAKITIQAVSAVYGEPVLGAISDPYYSQWVDRDATNVCTTWSNVQCIEGSAGRVIPCQ